MSLARQPLVTAAFTILLSAIVGCSSSSNTQADHLDSSFEQAALEYRVPKQILIGIGYTQTRLWMHAGEPGIGYGYGLMQLTDGGPDASLTRASRLTGIPVEQLKLDPASNIRGAAAILRDDANRYFGEYRGKHEDELAHWWQVVMRYPGYADPAAAEAFSSEVFQAVTKGFSTKLEDDSLFRQPGIFIDTAGEQIFASSSFGLTANYPSAEVHPASTNNYTAGRSYSGCSGRNCIQKVVIHTAQGGWSGTWSWFANASAQVSAHYTVRSSDGKVAQSVADTDTAWHAGNWEINSHSVGIEHEGYVDQPGYLTTAMYQGSANLTRWLCDTYGIPKDRSHIIGHNEVPDPNNAGQYGGSGHHSDPCVNVAGSTCYWNWADYMNLVNPQQTTPTNGVLQGFVFSSEGGAQPAGNTHPIAGATVTINTGASYVTDAKGFFKFDVAAGAYTVNAVAAGYTSAAPFLGNPRTVTASATTYASFVLNPIPTTGAVQVYVYEIQPLNTSDKSKAVDGAFVTVGGSSASAGADGRVSLTVGSGSQPVTVAKDGYDSSMATVNVTTNGTVSIDVGLKPTAVVAIGTVSVLTYEANPTNAADHTRLLSGAHVTIETQSCDSAADGKCDVQAEAGARQVQVAKDGYISRTVMTNVTANGTVTVEVGLDSTDNAPPTVAFTSPDDGTVFETVPVTVKGTATGRNITVFINGVSTTLAGDGTFTTAFSPMAGESAITAIARDEFGREAKATLHVVYDSHESGLQGTVINVVTGEPVSGVVLTSGSVVAQTGAEGTYSLPLAPGNQTVTLQAAGYVARDVPVIVNEGSVTNHNFELLPSSGTDDALEITSPRDGASVPGQTAEIVGLVRLAHIASVKVNGVEATLSSGTFKATAQTPAGVKTTILVSATSLDGIELMRTIVVTGTAPLKAKTGCTSAGEASVIAMLALIALRRRMRHA